MLTSCTCTMETHRQRLSLVNSTVVLDLGQAWALRTNFTLDLHQIAPLSTTGSKQHIEVCFLFLSYGHFLEWKVFLLHDLPKENFFFTEVKPCWTRLITRWMTLLDCDPVHFGERLSWTRLSVWLTFMHEVCIFSARVTRRQAIVMQVRLQVGREIKYNCCVGVLAWFSGSQLVAG